MCAGCVLRNAASSLRHFNLSLHCSCLHVRCCHRVCQIFAAFTPASISFCSRSCVQLQRPVLVFPLQQLQLLISLFFRHHLHRVPCSLLTCGPCPTTQPPKQSACVSPLVSLSRCPSRFPHVSCSLLICGPYPTTQPPKQSACVSPLVSLSRRHSPYCSCVSAARSPLSLWVLFMRPLSLPLCILSVMDVSSAFAAFSRCLIPCTFLVLRLSFVLQYGVGLPPFYWLTARSFLLG